MTGMTGFPKLCPRACVLKVMGAAVILVIAVCRHDFSGLHRARGSPRTRQHPREDHFPSISDVRGSREGQYGGGGRDDLDLIGRGAGGPITHHQRMASAGRSSGTPQAQQETRHLQHIARSDQLNCGLAYL